MVHHPFKLCSELRIVLEDLNAERQFIRRRDITGEAFVLFFDFFEVIHECPEVFIRLLNNDVELIDVFAAESLDQINAVVDVFSGSKNPGTDFIRQCFDAAPVRGLEVTLSHVGDGISRHHGADLSARDGAGGLMEFLSTTSLLWRDHRSEPSTFVHRANIQVLFFLFSSGHLFLFSLNVISWIVCRILDYSMDLFADNLYPPLLAGHPWIAKMNLSFQNEVYNYIDLSFSEEKAAELRASIFIFDAFGNDKVYGDFADVLYDFEAEDAQLTQFKFLSAVDANLNFILDIHRVKTKEETELMVKNLLCGVLFRLQQLEDPTPVLKILETYASNEEKLASIVEIYSDMDKCTILDAIDSIEDASLKALSDYLYAQEEHDEALANSGEITPENGMLLNDTLKLFFSTYGTDNLGFQMSESGILPGFSINLYLPYIKNAIIGENADITANNVLSLIYYAADTFNEPMAAYRSLSEDFGLTGEQIGSVESRVSKMVNEINERRKAIHDARSVSVTQHQA